MGLLSDIFSYGDTQKRRLKGLLQDPAGTLGLGAQRFAEDQRGLLGLMDQAGYTPGSRSVLQTPQGTAAARTALADKSMEAFGGLLGATVWHGSPHKFDRFDSSKIGTGEGNQAYGHGIYTAEAPAVAEQYAKDLSMRYSGKTTAQVQEEIKRVKDTMQGPLRSQALRQLDFDLEASKMPQTSPNVYKVGLPDEAIAKMLDHDKPFSQQSPDVQVAVKNAFADAKIPDAWKSDPSGESIHAWLSSAMGGGQNVRDGELKKRAAELLRSKGLTGLRYLDQGSRSAGAGSSNYVIFPKNEGLLQILERNGQPIK